MSVQNQTSNEIREIEFIWRHDCPFNSITREYPETTIRWPTPAIGVDEDTVVGVFSVNGDVNTNSLITKLESHPTVYHVECFVDTTFRAFLDRGMVTIPPELLAECYKVSILEHKGVEEWSILTGSKRVEDFLFQQLNQTKGAHFDLKRKITSPISEVAWDADRTLRDHLTEKQREAILIGLKRGYFEYPREETATEIADRLDITASSFLSRLHRGQRRVFEHVFYDELT